MGKRLINATYYIPLSIPILYFGMLFVSAPIYYQNYYSGLTQIPFSFYSLIGGGLFSVAALGATYVVAYQKQRELEQEHDNQTNSLQTRLEKYKGQLQTTEYEMQEHIRERNAQLNALQDRLAEYETQLKKVDKARQDVIQERNLLQERLEELENSFTKERQKHQSLIAKFLGTQDLSVIFNSDLLTDLQNRGPIEEVDRLSGGYSGAQLYSFKREGKSIYRILKVDKANEIDNEERKFNKYVHEHLANCPWEPFLYPPWGSIYKGFEYSFMKFQPDSDVLTLQKFYRQCLQEESHEIATLAMNKTITRLFNGLHAIKAWGWQSEALVEENKEKINIYAEHYPFAQKINEKIYPEISRLEKEWKKLDLINLLTSVRAALDKHLNIAAWETRKSDNSYLSRVARAIIHGDLNSRNILLNVNRDNHYDVYAIGLIDFSHTGNGLTTKRYAEAIEVVKDLHEDKGNLANDFCRLEADIKFYLTDLNSEEDLRQALYLECLLLGHGLELSDWEWNDPPPIAEDKNVYALIENLKLKDLADPSYWQRDNVRKFFLVWQSVKTIRSRFKNIVPPKLLSMRAFYMALFQASLSMSYYEDERFHNPSLQKLYLVLASGMLCEKLLEEDT